MFQSRAAVAAAADALPANRSHFAIKISILCAARRGERGGMT